MSFYHGCRAMSTGKIKAHRKDRTLPGSARIGSVPRCHHVRRLIANRRTMPPIHLGKRMHTILTRMLSPPASVEQRPAGAHQRCARNRRPGPARDAQQQQQQPCANERPAHKPPAAIVRGTPAPWRMLTGLILSLPHDDPPDSLADYALPRGKMWDAGWKKSERVTKVLHSSFTSRMK